MPDTCRATGAVTEVLVKDGVVLLNTGGCRCVAVAQGAVDHIKTGLSFVQSQLEVGSAGPGEVLSAPFNVEDAVGRNASNRSENPIPGV